MKFYIKEAFPVSIIYVIQILNANVAGYVFITLFSKISYTTSPIVRQLEWKLIREG